MQLSLAAFLALRNRGGAKNTWLGATLASVKTLMFVTLPPHPDVLPRVQDKRGGACGRATKESSRPPGSRALLRRIRRPARRARLGGGDFARGHQREGDAKLEADQRDQGSGR